VVDEGEANTVPGTGRLREADPSMREKRAAFEQTQKKAFAGGERSERLIVDTS
jgi:hypothetical protein